MTEMTAVTIDATMPRIASNFPFPPQRLSGAVGNGGLEPPTFYL